MNEKKQHEKTYECMEKIKKAKSLNELEEIYNSIVYSGLDKFCFSMVENAIDIKKDFYLGTF